MVIAGCLPKVFPPLVPLPLQSRSVEKVYVARVLGAFPSSDAPIAVDVPLAWDPVTNNATAVPEAAPRFAAQVASTGTAAAGQGLSAGQGMQAAAVPATVAAAGGVGGLAEVGAEGGGQPVEQQQGAEQQERDEEQQQQEDRRLRKAKWKALKREKKAAREAAAAAAAAASEERERDAIRGAKPALTEYRLLWVAPDGQTSLVECRWAKYS